MASNVENQDTWSDPLTGVTFHDLTGREHAIIHALNIANKGFDAETVDRLKAEDLADQYREILNRLEEKAHKASTYGQTLNATEIRHEILDAIDDVERRHK